MLPILEACRHWCNYALTALFCQERSDLPKCELDGFDWLISLSVVLVDLNQNGQLSPDIKKSDSQQNMSTTDSGIVTTAPRQTEVDIGYPVDVRTQVSFKHFRWHTRNKDISVYIIYMYVIYIPDRVLIQEKLWAIPIDSSIRSREIFYLKLTTQYLIIIEENTS